MPRQLSTLVLLLLISLGVSAEEYRAIVDIKAYNFPPPPDSVSKVLHSYNAGDSLHFEYGNRCALYACQVVTPGGQKAWVYSHKVAEVQSLSEEKSRYDKVGWDKLSEVDLKVWAGIRDEPRKLESCAMKLARDPDYKSSTDWPAYCNTFRHTLEVQSATADVRQKLAELDLPEEEKQMVMDRIIWIGAPKEALRLSWGLPEDINRTVTSSRTREQWVYSRGRYIYIENGVIVAVQD